MNSSRHANRPNRGQDPGRGGRGPGRGGRQNGSRPEFGSVPSIQQVVVGAPVSIVLKIDQPTGRQVQGTIAELLMRGNHPRGIKVRLQDGRVGRVQKMATEEEARLGSEGLTGLGRNGGREGVRNGGEGFSLSAAGGSGAFSGGRYGDFRVDALEEPERAELSLADYVVTKAKGKGKKASRMASDTAAEEMPQETDHEAGSEQPRSSVATVCPVCGDFEGDEIAISHHVNAHFE